MEVEKHLKPGARIVLDLFARKVLVTDPLPPSLEASPCRARPSVAALPLYQGESGTVDFARRTVPLREGDCCEAAGGQSRAI